MMMQHRITMMHDGKEIDMTRAMPKIDKEIRKMREDADNRHAASVDVVDRMQAAARWYCLVVRKELDLSVENSLVKSRIENYSPKETRVSFRQGRRIEQVLPYFPGYILVRIVPSDAAFRGLKSHEGVVGIVGDDVGCYHEIPQAEVDVFKKVCEPVSIERLAADKTIKQGDEADIVTGPFAGFLCIVTAVKWCRQARASVRIDMHGKAFDIDSMPVAFLKKL